MKGVLVVLDERLKPIEDLFFKWLLRVAIAGTLVGSAWIDDAPPLELAAMLVALYVLLRILLQSGSFFAAAPFEHRVWKALVAVIALVVLGLTFVTVEILVATLSSAAFNG